MLIVFDFLAGDDGKSLVKLSLATRRKLLEAFARKYMRGHKMIRLSPVTTKLAAARKWLKQVGANLDGIIAKRRDVPYESGNRHGMRKIKNYRSADCVIGGFRYNEGKRTVGSLLLGLYDEQGLLDHVGPLARTVGDCAVLFEVLSGAMHKESAQPGSKPLQGSEGAGARNLVLRERALVDQHGALAGGAAFAADRTEPVGPALE